LEGDRVPMSPAQREAGMCESQVLVLAKPGDFLISALYLSSPARTALSRGGIHLPNPKWVECGGKEKSKVSDTKPLFKYLVGHCVVPYLVHKPPGQSWIRGYTTWASGFQQLFIGFLDSPSGRERSLTSLELPGGILRHLLWPESMLVLSKREEGSLFF